MAETLALNHPLALPPQRQGPDSDAVILTAAPPLVLLDLRCRDKAALDAFLEKPVGLASPPVAQAVSNAAGTLFRFGPDWWQLRCRDRKLADRLLRGGRVRPGRRRPISPIPMSPSASPGRAPGRFSPRRRRSICIRTPFAPEPQPGRCSAG